MTITRYTVQFRTYNSRNLDHTTVEAKSISKLKLKVRELLLAHPIASIAKVTHPTGHEVFTTTLGGK